MQSFVIYRSEKNAEIINSAMLDLPYQCETIQVKNTNICLLDNDLINYPVTIHENKDSGYLLILQGRIEKVENESVLSKETTSLLNQILSLFLVKGKKAYSLIEGMFFLALCNLQDGSIIIGNDRLGLIPFYYHCHDETTVFSNNASLISRILRLKNLDFNAIASFFSMGIVLNERTFYEGISLFDPGSIYDSQNNNSIHRYWDFYISEKEELNHDQYLEASIELIKESIVSSVNPGEKFYVSLSGGLDSRWIAAVLADKFNEVNTVSYGIKDTHDPKYAEAVAKKIGAKHRFIQYDPGLIIDFADLAIELTHGMTSLQNFHDFLPSLKLCECDLNIKLSGYYIDLLFGVHLLGDHLGEQDQTEISTKDDLINYLKKKYFNGFKENELAILFNWSAETFSMTEELYKAVPVKYHAKERFNAEYFDYQQLLRRGRLPFQSWQANYGQYRLPFANYQLIDFCLNLPYHEKRNLKLYQEAFTKAYPDLSKIYSQRYNSRIDDSQFTKNMKLYWFYSQYASKRTLEVLSRGKRSFVLKRLWSNYDQWLRNDLNEWMEDSINNLRNIDFINFDYVQKIVHQHISGLKNNASKIYLLLTFSIWYRNFYK